MKSEFHTVINFIEQEIKAGYLLQYRTTMSQNCGIVVYVESDQGWNPEPYWQEFRDEQFY